MIRQRIEISGTVQGVGFRPFIYGLALAHSLTGFVYNHAGGVTIEVEGKECVVTEFRLSIMEFAPPLSRIHTLAFQNLPPLGDMDFVINKSQTGQSLTRHISPDVCTCLDCLNDVRSKENRRYEYPFTNCTNCGPRFTIIRDLPYDRPLTAMVDFPMCQECQAEYDDPLNRRFHAQPNCCPVCGPKLRLLDNSGEEINVNQQEIICEVAERIKNGQVIAVKGLGGFHLVCDPTGGGTQKLRRFKNRQNKPFALMFSTLETVKEFCEVSQQEELLLQSMERPILLLQRLNKNNLSHCPIAPNLTQIGCMLPYTPLHYLLLDKLEKSGISAIIATSANLSSEPICATSQEVISSLSPIIDAVLDHDRQIIIRTDDSVVISDEGEALFLRRSRGFAPDSISLQNKNLEPLLAVGGDLKNCFTLVDGNRALLSPHIGDMDDLRSQDFFLENCSHFFKAFDCQPQKIVMDAHPSYASSIMAKEKFAKVPKQTVFHHEAHIASCLADNSANPPVLGLAFDGTGYGRDGTIWGGEFILFTEDDIQRVGRFSPFPLSGGDQAVHSPLRVALGLLHRVSQNDETVLDHPLIKENQSQFSLLSKLIEKQIKVVETSSLGRLFDAAAALLGICDETDYEAQAAMQLEAKASLAASNSPLPIISPMERNGLLEIELNDLLAPFLHTKTTTCESTQCQNELALLFHQRVAGAAFHTACQLLKQYKINSVALSGGCFLNRLLLNLLRNAFREANIQVFTHRLVPPGDGGLSLGQAWLVENYPKDVLTSD